MLLITKTMVGVALRSDSERTGLEGMCHGVSLTPRSLICMKVTKTSQGHPLTLFSVRGPKALHSLIAAWSESEPALVPY